MAATPFPFAEFIDAPAQPKFVRDAAISELIAQYEAAFLEADTAADGFDGGYSIGRAEALETALAAVLNVPATALAAHSS